MDLTEKELKMLIEDISNNPMGNMDYDMYHSVKTKLTTMLEKKECRRWKKEQKTKFALLKGLSAIKHEVSIMSLDKKIIDLEEQEAILNDKMRGING